MLIGVPGDKLLVGLDGLKRLLRRMLRVGKCGESLLQLRLQACFLFLGLFQLLQLGNSE